MKGTPLLVFGLIAASSAAAQQVRPLQEVKTIGVVTLPNDSAAMNNAFVRQIQQSGLFKIVLERNDPNNPVDAILSPVYGCSTRTGEYLSEKQRQTMHGLCGVRLIDPFAEDANGRLLAIWSGRFWRIPELYSEVERLNQSGQPVDVQEFVAKGVMSELLTDRQLALEGKQQARIQTLSLGQVKTIYVSLGDYNDETSADKLLETEMRRWLVKWVKVKGQKKWDLVGDDSNGVESVLPGIRLVFSPTQADAVWIGPYTHKSAGPVFYTSTGHATTTLNSDASSADTDVSISTTAHQRITEAGTAILFDRRTGQTIWSTTKNDYQWWVGLLAGGSNTGPATILEKLAKQLRKDYEKAVGGR